MPALVLRGLARADDGDLVAARADCERAVRLEPANADGHAALGWVRQRHKDWRGAAEAFRRFLRISPSHDPRIARARARLAECETRLRAEQGAGKK